MWNDAVDLRDFYRSTLGQMAWRLIRRHVRTMWPNAAGLNIMGIGYPTPYLLPFREEAQRVVAAMPAPQGVLRWPREGRNLVTLTDESELPFPDVSFDRVLMVHAIEGSEQLRPLMREVWRILTDGGRVMVIVPNRLSIWARTDRTPFGHGHPYTAAQISRFLRDNMFTPTETGYGLFAPPTQRRVIIHSAPAWEKIGSRWFPQLGGVVIMEASKQIYAGTAIADKAQKRRARMYVPAP